MKILIWSLLVLTIAGCSSLAGNPPGAASQRPEIELPTAEDTVVSQTTPIDEQPMASPTALTNRADLEDYGPAPELTNDTWLNVSKSLRLADLRGQVVLIDMWTYG